MTIYIIRYYLEAIADWAVCGMYANLEEAQRVAANLEAKKNRFCMEWHVIY